MGAKAESDIKHFALEAQLLSLVFLCIFFVCERDMFLDRFCGWCCLVRQLLVSDYGAVHSAEVAKPQVVLQKQVTRNNLILCAKEEKQQTIWLKIDTRLILKGNSPDFTLVYRF